MEVTEGYGHVTFNIIVYSPTLVGDVIEKFNVIQLNRWSDDALTTPDGKVISASAWATELGLGFSPAIVLFDQQKQQVMIVDAMFKICRCSRQIDSIGTLYAILVTSIKRSTKGIVVFWAFIRY